jgi:hypothetical protein
MPSTDNAQSISWLEHPEAAALKIGLPGTISSSMSLGVQLFDPRCSGRFEARSRQAGGGSSSRQPSVGGSSPDRPLAGAIETRRRTGSDSGLADSHHGLQGTVQWLRLVRSAAPDPPITKSFLPAVFRRPRLKELDFWTRAV